MKSRINYSQKHPELGNRSAVYFGIGRLFDPEWFNKTSHCGAGTTHHPTLRPLRGSIEREQQQLRMSFIRSLHNNGYSCMEALKQWQIIISEATRLATELFDRLCPKTRCSVQFSKEMVDDVKIAATKGLEYIKEQYTLVCGTFPAQQDMFHGGDMVYLRRYPELKEGHFYHVKIGRTSNCNQRRSAYKHATGGTLETVWEFMSSHALSEDSLRDALLANKSNGVRKATGKDWFYVPVEIYSQIATPCDASKFIAMTCES